MLFAVLRRGFAAIPASAQRSIEVDIGTQLDLGTLVSNIVNYLAASIGFLTVAVFIYGALLFTASGAHEEWREKGKQMMLGSLIGMVVVLSAYALLRTVTYLLVG